LVFCCFASEAPARRNAAGLLSLPATERLQLRFDCGVLDPGPQKLLPNDPNNGAPVVGGVVSWVFWTNKKPVNHLRLTGFKTGGMDGTRIRPSLSLEAALLEVNFVRSVQN
jgi:hypothetical protein